MPKRKGAGANCPPCDELLGWCDGAGITVDGVALCEDATAKSRGFVATSALAVGHCILSVPHAAIVTTDVAMSSSIGKAIQAESRLRVVQNLDVERRRWEAGETAREDEATEVVTRRSVLYAFLIHQRHIEQAGKAWRAYARSLPDVYRTPFTWNASDFGYTPFKDEVESLGSWPVDKRYHSMAVIVTY